jgi:hypothetical protein
VNVYVCLCCHSHSSNLLGKCLVEDEQLLCDNNLKYQANLVSNNLLNCHVNPETTEHDHLICGRNQIPRRKLPVNVFVLFDGSEI